MFEQIKTRILSNWNFIRLLRLGIGIAVLIQSILLKDWTLGIAGLIFASLAILNQGCCGANNCTVKEKKVLNEKKEITYEEVDTK